MAVATTMISYGGFLGACGWYGAHTSGAMHSSAASAAARSWCSGNCSRAEEGRQGVPQRDFELVIDDHDVAAESSSQGRRTGQKVDDRGPSGLRSTPSLGGILKYEGRAATREGLAGLPLHGHDGRLRTMWTLVKLKPKKKTTDTAGIRRTPPTAPFDRGTRHRGRATAAGRLPV